jgi:hypothetical protein
LSVLASTYSPHLLFQQQSISTNGLQCRWQPFPHFSEKPSERGGEKKEKRANASRRASPFGSLHPVATPATATQAPHRHSPANPRRHAELRRVAGYPRARAHASIHLHPSAASPAFAVGTAPATPSSKLLFSSPLHRPAHHQTASGEPSPRARAAGAARRAAPSTVHTAHGGDSLSISFSRTPSGMTRLGGC